MTIDVQTTEPQTDMNPYGFKDEMDEAIASKLLIGYSIAAVAREFVCTYQTVYNRCNHPTFIKAMKVYQLGVLAETAKISSRLQLAANVSLDKLIGLLDSPDVSEVRQVAFGLLDRAGHSVKQDRTITHKFEMDERAAKLISETFKEVNGVEVDGTANG